ncbi:hypothetical protein [Halalkalicoccus ordinarius]|uniref:hypothetical protein n=1 Tax=Halalkalicoccus ordinarius TaxID=3116651 RepID=UPI00300E9358
MNARTTTRINRAGMAAIAGSIALAISLIGHEVARYRGIDGTIDVPGTLGFFLSYGSLSLAWGLLFLGSLGFAALVMRTDDRLVKVGAGAVSLGLAGTALGFGFAALAGLAGLGDVAMIGEMIAAPSMMLLFTLGSLVLGIELLRTEIVSRAIAGLMTAVGPGMILGVMIGVPVLDIVLFAGPVCAVWALIGYDLLSTDTTIEEPSAVPA